MTLKQRFTRRGFLRLFGMAGAGVVASQLPALAEPPETSVEGAIVNIVAGQTFGGVYYSRNSGVTWTRIDTPPVWGNYYTGDAPDLYLSPSAPPTED